MCALVIALTACTGDKAQRPAISDTPVEESGSKTASPGSVVRTSEGRISAQGGEVLLTIEQGRRLPRYVIHNKTDAVIGYGYPYVFSTKRGGTWREIKNHPRCVFTLPLLMVQPEERSNVMRIGRCNEQGETEIPTPGLYRIEKVVELADGSRVPIFATFRVSFG